MKAKWTWPFIGLWLVFGTFAVRGQTPEQLDRNAVILGLMEDLLEKVQPAIQAIDPELKRIALYRLTVQGRGLTPPLRDHFENRLIETLQTLDHPRVVSLPKFNNLRITSTDSSFMIINALPTPDELWRVGRRLRVDAFLEGKLSYLPGNGLILDLRLNRTGTNEVLWAESFEAYEKPLEPLPKNPFQVSFNMGVETFPVDIDKASRSLLRQDFQDQIYHYSFYLGFRQNLWEASKFRYEFQVGASLLSEGIKLDSTYFEEDAFYGQKSDKASSLPIAYFIRSLLAIKLIENEGNVGGDWLSLTLGFARYFAKNMPDFNTISIGLRSDISPHFSLSSGFSLAFGQEFESVPVSSTGQPIRIKISGISMNIFFLQYTF
ncbi:MAG: hypothetical protein Q9P14_12955 [candidate division KSB1 bacterium]|nr:hypothetical protein [candidate division KSB1 bacterium]MDQ7063985.1 hypothetical protein [candidate division KSB1 bacterium]